MDCSLMKIIKIIIFVIFCIYCFKYLISINKNNISNCILNNKTNRIKNVTVRSLFSNEILEEFSGEYKDLSSLELINNNHKYLVEEIYFVLTTNSKRLEYTINFIKFWSKLNNLKCLIVFEKGEFVRHSNIKLHLKNEGIKCEISLSNIKRYEERYFQLIQFAFNDLKRTDQLKSIKWFCISDDDTIWFINNLLKVLEEYNSSKLIYLGNISGRNETIQRHGNYYAYGGAGILFSKPLVQLFSQSFNQCQQFIKMFGGDEMIGKCLTQILKINLTINKHFHQIDYTGDIDGFFQSGIDGLASLHHMFSLWEPFPEEHIQNEKDILNNIQLAFNTFQLKYLKRFFKINYQTNQTLLLTIGYSFTLFNRILSIEELNQMELTWCCDNIYQRRTRKKETNKSNWFFKQLTNQITNESIYQNYQQQQFHNEIQITFNN